MYWITSSRRSCSKSTSMSGGSLRSRLMKRSNSRCERVGSTAVIPRQKQTAELAAEPRPWHRMPMRAGEAHDVVHRQEVHLVGAVGDQVQLAHQLLAHAPRHALRIAVARAFDGEAAQRLPRRQAGGTVSSGYWYLISSRLKVQRSITSSVRSSSSGG
jgi:hypothetical protein